MDGCAPAISGPISASVTCCGEASRGYYPSTTHRVMARPGRCRQSRLLAALPPPRPDAGALERHTAHSYLMERLRGWGDPNPARPGRQQTGFRSGFIYWHDWLVIRILLVNDAKTEFYIGYTPSDCAPAGIL